MDALPDLGSLSDEELDSLIRALERDEDAISKRRRLLHGRIDLLRAERVERLRVHVADGDVDLPAPTTLERPLFQGTGELPGDEGELEAMPDLATLSDDELRTMILDLEHEEDDVSLQRRFLQGRIDILRAERALRSRGGGRSSARAEPAAGLGPEGLADVLSGGHGGA